MENRKRSRAFIITFIAVIILLTIVYFVFRHKDKISNISGTTGGQTNSQFDSLGTTQGQGTVSVIDGTTSGTKEGSSTSSTGTGTNSGNGTPATSGVNSGTGEGGFGGVVKGITTSISNFFSNLFGGGSSSSTTGAGSSTGFGSGTITNTTGTGTGAGVGVGAGSSTGTGAGTGVGAGTGTGASTGVGAGTGTSVGTGTGTGTGNSGISYGDTGVYLPAVTPLPPPSSGTSTGSGTGTVVSPIVSPQCSDGKDNNNNGLIDSQEPSCHTDLDATNLISYDPKITSESRVSTSKSTGEPTTNPNVCPSDPLYFTADEQAQLDSLIRQYYLIAASIKSQNDLDILNNDIVQNESLINTADDLITQCKADKADPSYTGPQTIKDNPYYSGGTAVNFKTSYLPGQISEWITRYTQANSSPSGSGINDLYNFTYANPVATITNGTDIIDYADFERTFNIW